MTDLEKLMEEDPLCSYCGCPLTLHGGDNGECTNPDCVHECEEFKLSDSDG